MRRVADILDNRVRNPGGTGSSTFDSDPAGVAVLVGESRVKMIVERLNWPVRPVGFDVIESQLWMSLDNGATWRQNGGFTALGGNRLDERGNVPSSSELRVPFPKSGSTDRKLRVRIEVHASIRTAVHLDLE